MPKLAKRTWQTVVSVAGACILLYFLYHTIEGDRGWLTMLKLKGQVGEAQKNLTKLQKENDELDHRVQLMRPDSMDPDLLDEKSREMLNYSNPNDIIILTPPVPTPLPQLQQDPNLLQRNK